MRSGYVVLIWDPASAEAAADALALGAGLAAVGFRDARLKAPGASLHLDPERGLPHRWNGDAGVLQIGWLFERGEAASPPPLVAPPAVGAESAFAAELSRRAWGAYVAVRPDGRGGGRAFRTPSGALEALTWRAGGHGVGVVAEDLAGLPPRLWPGELALDWDAISDMLARPTSAWGAPALAGVMATAPGDVQVVGTSARLAVWRPADWARTAEDPPSAVWEARLRACAAAVVAAETGPHDALVAEVSGGLDSAVVAALATRAAGPRVRTAVNLHAAHPGGDERLWARCLCTALGLPLREVEWALRPLTAEDLSRFAGGARPAFNALDPWLDACLAEVVREVGATGLLTGYGGDAVFFQMPSATPIADRGQAIGLRALLEPLPRQFARWRRRSVWSVWAEALARPPARPPAAILGAELRGWRPRSPPHPWLEGLEALPRGKQLQIAHLAIGQSSYGPARRRLRAALIQPLIAQPMLELCLSIPTWRLVEGGRDRALARRAFADLLPEPLVSRRTKGAVSGYYTQVIAASLPVLRPHLLDGVLAARGLLDRAALERALTAEDLFMAGQAAPLLQAAAVESWVRWWQGFVPDAPGRERQRRMVERVRASA